MSFRTLFYKRRVLAKAFLIAGGIFLAIFISELVLFSLDMPKFYNYHTIPSQFAFYRTGEDTISYINLPLSNIQFVYDGDTRGYFGKQNEVNHKTNSWGFRGGEFSFVKPKDTFRIAFLGDSFTFGEGVKFDDVYSQKLVQLLEEKYKSKNISFESYNFGVGGYNTAQSLNLLKNQVLSTQPDAIVLGYILNDAEPDLFYVELQSNTVVRRPREARINEGLSDNRPPDNLFFNLRVTKLIWKVLDKKRQSQRTIDYYNCLFDSDNPNWQRNKRALKDFVDICRENNIACYVVCFPILFELNDNYPFRHIHELIKREVGLAGSGYVHFIDLFDYLKGIRDIKLWVHPTDQHPNEIVHRIAAEALSDFITVGK